MKILSIDVGMKCLAYCSFSIDETKKYAIKNWGVLDLCNEKKHKCCGKTAKNKPCDKNSKYHKNEKYFCKIHAKKQNYKMPTNELKKTNVKKLKITELKTLIKKYEINISFFGEKKVKKVDYQNIIFDELDTYYLNFVENIKARSIKLTTYGKKLKEGFEGLFDLYDFDIVIVENQIGPLALRMKTLQGMIMQHFIERNIRVEEISAANKLKDYIPSKKKTKYSERKKLGISVTKSLLNENILLEEWLQVFIKHSKKDDLADSFLQGLWYIKHKL
jgi:hypothetical protein